MRVVCTEIRNQVTGNSEDKSPWLQIDHEYDVLEVAAYPGGRVELRLVSEDADIPALFDAAMFMTIDGRVPGTWEARLEEGGVLRLGPPEWMAAGFWEAYFDREPVAVEAYERGRRRAL